LCGERGTSRALLVDVRQRKFRGVRPGDERDPQLLDWLRGPGASSSRRLENGVRTLSRLVRAGVDTRAGTVTIAFEAQDPRLAKMVLDTLLDDLNRFNLSTRRSQASEKRQFIESQRG